MRAEHTEVMKGPSARLNIDTPRRQSTALNIKGSLDSKIWAFKPQGAQADELVNILNTSLSQAAFKFEQDSRKVLC